MILLMVWAAMQSCRLKADQTVSGNLTVTGSNVYMGTQVSTTNPGWGTIYTDGTNSTIDLQATRAGNTWAWLQSDGSILQMTLDFTNTLTLYNSSGTAEITLNPTGTSSLAGSVTIGGTNNTMPNQTLTGSSSVLTEALADSRYAPSSALAIGTGTNPSWNGGGTTSNLGLNGGTAGGGGAFAEGAEVVASGNVSTALGAGTTASGNYTLAIGVLDTASGEGSTVLGNLTTASGYGATALGNRDTASGNFSLTLGSWTTANGTYATASGLYTTAQAYDSFVLGTYNVGGGNETSWVSTDPLFEIGNGTGTNATSDALVVYKNGNVAAGGTVTAPAYITTTQTGDIPMYSGD